MTSFSRIARTLLSCLALLGGLSGATAAAAGTTCLTPLAPCGAPEMRIRATLDPDTGTVRAITEVRLLNCTDGDLHGIPMLLPAANLSAPPEDLDDRNFSWRFPGGISRAVCTVEAAEVLSGPGLARDPAGPCRPVTELSLSEPLRPGEALVLRLTTRIRVPIRFGTFGATRGMLTLRGAWHPTLPALEADGFRPDAVPGRTRYDVAVTPSRRTRILLGPLLASSGPGKPVIWAGESRDPLALVAAPTLRRTTIRAAGRRVDLIHRVPPRGPRDPLTPGELLQTDWLREQIAGVERVLRGLQDPFEGDHWTLVVVPMRETLAMPGAELIFVAESLYEITSVGLLNRYHDAALSAALVTGSLRRAHPETHPWIALVAGAYLRSRVRSAADLDAVRELARKGEFVYAIDQFGTDAQIPQEDLFFQRVKDRNPFADEAEFAASTLPSPWAATHLLQEIAAVRALDPNASDLAVTGGGAASLVGPRWAPAFCAWVDGGHRDVLDLSVRHVPERRMDGSPATLVVSHRTGPLGGLPVRIRIEHENGGVRDVVWDTGQQDARWRVGGEVRRAEVDPDERILQRRTRPTRNLRFDDASRQDLKWVFARPWLSFTSGEPIPTAYIELNLQRRHDLRSTWVLQPRLFPERAELLVGHRWGFGALARPNRNRWQLTLGVKGAAGFDHGGSFSPGVKALLYFDNRKGLFTPFRGGWAYTYAEVFPGDTRGGWRPSSKLGIGGARLFGTRPDLVFVLRGMADTRLGPTPDWESLQVGGILGVRGLSVAGFTPKHRLAGSAELRWMPLRNLRVSFLKSIFLRGIQFVLFSDAALLGTDYDAWFQERTLYQSAGLGIRFHADLFGVFPALLAIDQAVVLPLYGKELAFGTLAYFSQAF